jgi:uncharacterized protein YcbK (DUF882 family)
MVTSRTKSSPIQYDRGVSRRTFLAAGVATAVACFSPYKAFASVLKAFPPEKALAFYNTHTGETLKTVYWDQGTYVPQALAEINHILRDYRTGEVREIEPVLLDLLFALHQKLGSGAPFSIISGYRSPETNSLLSSMSKGVAKNSMHLLGKAIDIRLPGHELKTLQSAAVDLRRGGVGYYPSSDFVHVDVGRVRYW